MKTFFINVKIFEGISPLSFFFHFHYKFYDLRYEAYGESNIQQNCFRDTINKCFGRSDVLKFEA